MTLFYVLYVRRSDGKLETLSSKSQKEKNEPTLEQLDQTPNAQGVSDYYRPIAEDEPKYIDWRRKLGGMLAREIAGKDYQCIYLLRSSQIGSSVVNIHTADKAYILHALPYNYRLYEHIKSKSGDGSEPKAKNHAGGGHDRQDAYLYGHPSGRKKRFRSPADFFPHLLWLATDSKGDQLNCSCKICSPDDLQPEVPKEVKQPPPLPKKEEPLPKSPALAKQQVAEPQAPIKRPSSQNGPKQAAPTPSAPTPPVPTPQPAGTPQSTPATPAQAPAPAPLPQPRSADQQLDTYYNRLVYRAGEVVWFNKGQAWGLGVIARRWWATDNSQRETRGYFIQPLSHPLHHPPQIHINDEKNLRPWLAWSAPSYTNDMLNQMNVTFDTADWDGILAKRYGQGDAEVDGSILAARATDSKYTLGELLSKRQISPTAEIRQYNSIFLGGEKIWIGEPVRIRLGTGTDIMIVSTIEVRVQALGAAPTTSAIVLTGDIYQYVTAPHSHHMNLPSDKHLPLRVREDLRYRNSITIPTRRAVSFWKLSASPARVDIADIKGRWYESGLLMPLLNDYFQEAVKRGEVEDCNLWMNARGDASSGQNVIANGRNERKDAFGQAVPANFSIIEGHQPPFPEEIAALSASASNFQAHDPLMPDSGAFDQLMDLDAMEHDAIPAFGQEYGPQDSYF